MSFPIGQAPEHLQLGGFAKKVLDTVAQYTAFPWPIFSIQCQRVGIDPCKLTPQELVHVAKNIVAGVTSFTSQEKGAALLRELQTLAGDSGF